MKHVIVDFDNTMGVKGCDVDDGLALLYLLGNPELCQVHAACTTYGNSTLDIVHENTLRLFEELGIAIPVYRGAPEPALPNGPTRLKAFQKLPVLGDVTSDAARFMADAAAAEPGKYSILATGSTTNLLGAWQLDPHFFENVAEVVLMGGITESLVITEGRIMDELNLSCDPDATLAILGSGTRVSIATANNCLPAYFERETFLGAFPQDSWLSRMIDYWFGDMVERYAWPGFVVWDMVAAAILIKPELFEDVVRDTTLYRRMLAIGYLEQAAPGAPSAPVHTPVIADARALIDDALASWKRALDSFCDSGSDPLSHLR